MDMLQKILHFAQHKAPLVSFIYSVIQRGRRIVPNCAIAWNATRGEWKQLASVLILIATTRFNSRFSLFNIHTFVFRLFVLFSDILIVEEQGSKRQISMRPIS